MRNRRCAARAEQQDGGDSGRGEEKLANERACHWGSRKLLTVIHKACQAEFFASFPQHASP
jgi:hypothetical protein